MFCKYIYVYLTANSFVLTRDQPLVDTKEINNTERNTHSHKAPFFHPIRRDSP